MSLLPPKRSVSRVPGLGATPEARAAVLEPARAALARAEAAAAPERLPLPAAGNGRIHVVDGTLVSWYGPRIPRAVDRVRPLLAPSPPSFTAE